jgi:hypothetical protein
VHLHALLDDYKRCDGLENAARVAGSSPSKGFMRASLAMVADAPASAVKTQ